MATLKWDIISSSLACTSRYPFRILRMAFSSGVPGSDGGKWPSIVIDRPILLVILGNTSFGATGEKERRGKS